MSPVDQLPLLIRGAQLILADGSTTTGDLLILDGRIAGISPDGIDQPDAEVVDGAGKTVMPGLIDAHLHLDFLSVRNGLQGHLQARRLAGTLHELLHSGVTTIRTMADPLDQIRWLQRQVATGRFAGPKLIIAGPALTAPGGHPAVTVCRDNPWLQRKMVRYPTDAEEARSIVRSLHRDGVDLIKIVFQGGSYAEFGDVLNKLSTEAVRGVLAEAHELGLSVSAHTHYQQDVEQLLDLGIDSIEHGVIEESIGDQEFLQKWVDAEAFLVPTLTISQWVRDVSGRPYLVQAGENLRRAYEAGVRIAAGTDSMAGAMSAGSLHEELQLMVTAGLPTSAVIQAATSHAADLLGLSDRGRIEVGAVADLLVLNADPLDAIEHTADLSLVIQDGRIVHRVSERDRIELPEYLPQQEIRDFRDATGGAFDDPVEVHLDCSRFAAEGLRTISYLDPVSRAVLRTETLRSEPNLLTREWTCVIPADGTELTARLVGQQIQLTGTFGNESVSRSHPVRGGRWLQGMIFDAATFITSTHRTVDFLAIGTTGRGALEASEFCWEKSGSPTGQEISATLVMPKWRRFWSAEARFDATTGDLLRYAITGRRSAVLERL